MSASPICRIVRADTPEAAALLHAYFEELAALLGGFDPTRGVPAEPDQMAPPNGVFLLLGEPGRAVACGGLRTVEPGVGEIKRMFVAPEARGRGLGRALLRSLEEAARGLRMTRIVLDTAAPLLAAAELYRAEGYQEV